MALDKFKKSLRRLVADPDLHRSIVEEEGEQFAEYIFKSIGRNPLSWIQTAVILEQAASYLNSSLGFGGPPHKFTDYFSPDPDTEKKMGQVKYERAQFKLNIYLMLMGFAVENLLKGFIVREEPELVSNEIKEELSMHKFVSLSNRAKVHSQLKDYEPTLKMLEVYVRWAGRYPLRLNANEKIHPSVDDPEKRAKEVYEILIKHACALEPDLEEYGIHLVRP